MEDPSSLVDDDTAEPTNEVAETYEEFPLNGQPIVMDDVAFNNRANTLKMTMETSSEEIQLPKESEEETNEKPKGLVPDPNEAEVVAEKKQTNMASKKRKSDEGLASPTGKKIKEEPLDSFELRGSQMFLLHLMF